MKRTSELVVSALILVLATGAAITGLSVPSVYRDAPSVVPQALGQDVVTLFVVVPLLAIATIALRRGSVGGRLLWLGALGYMVYAYGTYALWAHWNPLFLVYVALFGLSLYTVALGLVRTDATKVWAAFVKRPPARPIAWFFFVTAFLVSALWLSEEVMALVKGVVPPSIVQAGSDTNIVHVFDLGVVMPAFVIAGVLLVRDHPWGYVLAGLLLVKAATIGLAVVAMMWFMARAGFPVTVPYAVFFVALTASAVGYSWRLLAALQEPFTRDSPRQHAPTLG
jgi:hypothetical protein